MRCPNCQTLNPSGARFCNNCGNPLSQARPLDGERRLISILFADVVGSTSMAEKVDPEEWSEVMNEAIGFMIREVTHYEGTVSRLMGDGLLALFGAPVSHENDAERAVMAALGIRNAAAEYAVRLRSRYGFEFTVRSGINTGLVVLTRVGDENKAEYTAMGDAANLAARLQSLAPAQGVLIGPETHELVRHKFVTTARGQQTIKGKSGTLGTFEVMAPRVGGGQVGDQAVTFETPFVGRESEFEELRSAVQRALAGEASIAFVVGEAGIGKSRLISEVRRSLAPDVRWFEGRAISYARNSPLHPWQESLIASLGLPEGAAAGDLKSRLAEIHPVAAHAPERPAWFLLLALLLGLGDDDDRQAQSASNADDAVRTMAVAVTQHLRRLVKDGPLVLLLDDLHWADQATVHLLESLARSLRDEPIAILCPLRPDRHAPSWGLLEQVEAGSFKGETALLELIKLRPLDGAAAEALVDDLLALDSLPPSTRSTILRKAEGNPFFLEEVIHSLIDSEQATNEGGRWRLRQDVGELSVPDTLAGVLSARIDRLPPSARNVAQTAAVIGRYFASRLLTAVMREPGAGHHLPDIGPELHTLTVEDLVNRTVPESEIDYRFKHELTKDAAYQRLLLRRRRQLHGRVGDELKALYGDHEAEIAKDLAHHYYLGERWLDAARWGLEAARAARVLYSLPESQELCEAALAAVELAQGAAGDEAHSTTVGVDTASEARRLEAEIVGELVGLGILMRLHEDPSLRVRQLELAQRAVELAESLGDKSLQAKSLVNLGNLHVLSGFPITGFDPLLKAHDLAFELGQDNLVLMPFWVATEIMLDDKPDQAAKQFDEVIKLARKVGNLDIEAHALGTKSVALARIGEFKEAREVADLALEAAEASGSIIKRADVALMVGSVLLEMGRPTKGLEHIERGTDLALSVNGMECVCSGLQLLGDGQLADNQLSEAVRNLHRSLEYAVGIGYESVLHNVRASLASARFKEGDTAAIEAIEVEIDNAEAFKDGFGASRARMNLAQALVSVGRPARAEGHIRRALLWFEERGMKPYAMRGNSVLAEALAAQGDEAGAAAASQLVAELRASISWPAEHSEPLNLSLERGANAPSAGSE